MQKVFRKKYLEINTLDLAIERINRAYDLFDHILVSFSGGKDSTVCLNLTLGVARERSKLPLRVIFYDEEAIPYETETYVREVSKNKDIDLEWYCLPIKSSNACSNKQRSWYPWAPEVKELWVRSLPPEAITSLSGFPEDVENRLAHTECNALLCPAEVYGTAGIVMGIRTEESLTRYRAVSRKKHDNYINQISVGKSWGSARFTQNNAYKVYPIYDWTTQDVWTAPKKFGWKVNPAYDAMDKAGITPHKQRVCPPYGEEPIRQLWMYKVCFPDIWEKMAYRVPGAATAARYGGGELYSFGKVPEKPKDMTWEQFILHFIKKFNPVDQRRVAIRIKKEIKRHERKTKDPILPTAKHPYTGLSWEWLTMIAIRGDFRERKKPDYGLDNTAIEGHVIKYAEEYEQVKGRPYKGDYSKYLD